MNTISLKQYCKDKEIIRISNVRANEKGYPFLTVVNQNNEAENIYFSKAASQRVELHQQPSLFANQLFIAETKNEQGEDRLKLSFTQYEDVAELFNS